MLHIITCLSRVISWPLLDIPYIFALEIYSCTVDRTRRSRDVQTLVLTYWPQTEYLEYNVQQSKFLLFIYSNGKKRIILKLITKRRKHLFSPCLIEHESCGFSLLRSQSAKVMCRLDVCDYILFWIRPYIICYSDWWFDFKKYKFFMKRN